MLQMLAVWCANSLRRVGSFYKQFFRKINVSTCRFIQQHRKQLAAVFIRVGVEKKNICFVANSYDNVPDMVGGYLYPKTPIITRLSIKTPKTCAIPECFKHI